MEKVMIKFNGLLRLWMLAVITAMCTPIAGCGKGGLEGYTNDWLYPRDVTTAYVEMFDTQSFRRGPEHVVTDANCNHM